MAVYSATYPNEVQIDYASSASNPIRVRFSFDRVDHTAAGFQFVNPRLTAITYNIGYNSSYTRYVYIRSSYNAGNLTSATCYMPAPTYAPATWQTTQQPSTFTIPASNGDTSCDIIFVWSGADSGTYGVLHVNNLPVRNVAPAKPVSSGIWWNWAQPDGLSAFVSVSDWGYPDNQEQSYLKMSILDTNNWNTANKRSSIEPGRLSSGSMTVNNSSTADTDLDVRANTRYWYGFYAFNSALGTYSDLYEFVSPCQPLAQIYIDSYDFDGSTVTANVAWTRNTDGNYYTRELYYYDSPNRQWVNCGSCDNISGTISIEGLSPNTAYSIEFVIKTDAVDLEWVGSSMTNRLSFTTPGLPKTIQGAVYIKGKGGGGTSGSGWGGSQWGGVQWGGGIFAGSSEEAAAIQGATRISRTESATISGKANIAVTKQKDIQGVARIAKDGLAAISGTVRVARETNVGIDGSVRITSVQTASTQGTVDIIKASSQTIEGAVRIKGENSQTIQGAVNIYNPSQRVSSQDINGVVSVLSSNSREITGQTNVAVTSTDTINGQVRVGTVEDASISGQTWIEATSESSIDGSVDIMATLDTAISGQTWVQRINRKEISGMVDIIKAQTAKLSGLTRVLNTYTKDIAGQVRIRVATPEKLPEQWEKPDYPKPEDWEKTEKQSEEWTKTEKDEETWTAVENTNDTWKTTGKEDNDWHYPEQES